MFVQALAGGQIRLVTSASDLTAANDCEFAFLRRVDAKLGRAVHVPENDDVMRRRAATLGDAHERRTLEHYRSQFPGAVAEIARPDDMSEAALLQRQAQTLERLRGDDRVVFQATFFDPSQVAAGALCAGDPEIGFVGFADFLLRTGEGRWQVQDTKLARRAKVTALMQLAAYAEQVERLGVRADDAGVLILGDETHASHRLADVAPVFRARRARLHEVLLDRARATGTDGLRASAAPIAWNADGVAWCGRCEVCEPEVVRSRDPLLIAGVTRSQRDRLVSSGITTIDLLAEQLPLLGTNAVEVAGVSAPVLERLGWQAALQVERGDAAVPPVRITDPLAFAALPRPNPGDLFFDFEGDPMHVERDAEGSAVWGLDYLFGMVDPLETFTAIWAHDLDAERQALETFVQFVTERRRQYPGMHIYHYAPYERTHLSSIAARHAVCEAEIDAWLREHLLVDLYPIVRRGLRVGSRSYSIKKLEPLYMGDDLRDDTGVIDGAQSVIEYALANEELRSGDSTHRESAGRRLDSIAEYNRYDCVSTLRLRDWLLRQALEHGIDAGMIDASSVPSNDAGEQAPPAFRQSEVALALQMHGALETDEARRQLIALAASAIDYHEREHKSFWWEHFARLEAPIEEWGQGRDRMLIDARASRVELDWFRLPNGRVERREVRLSGELPPGSSFKPGAQVYAVYDRPAPFRQRGAAPGARSARIVTVLEVHDDGVTIGETLPQDTAAYHVLPLALTAGPPPPAGEQKNAILEWGRALIDALDRGALPADPAVGLLMRSRPAVARMLAEALDAASDQTASLARGTVVAAGCGAASFDAAHGASEDLTDDGTDDPIETVFSWVTRLRRGALPVQGPPGTGKTYLAAHVITRLVRECGWRIGVVAQSHQVVEHLLTAVVAAGLDPSLVAKAPQSHARGLSPEQRERLFGATPDWAATVPFTPLGRGGHARFLRDHAASGCVIGGTAWDFSNSQRIGRRELDLLVIDEAGQFSLAPTIAASVSAERMLLLGDPQQLPQVSQGTHPAPVDTSALGWLLDGRDTMPDHLGVFLAETRRMHEELAEIVSDVAYQGRLRAHSSTADRVVVGAGPAGLTWHAVSHAGNTTSSVEEAAEVVRVARALLQGTLQEPGIPERALTPADLIVVAAYNAQVDVVHRALEAAGLGAVRVGTVDKFQGQEAVMSIVTLAASSIADVPRGVEFLLLRNRLNVAISRAQWAAHLISSDRLGDGLPSSAEGVVALAGYLRLLELAYRADGSVEA